MMSNPYTAVLGSVLGSGVLNTPPAGPSNASNLGQVGGATFDSSGWNVVFGKGNSVAQERTQTEQTQLSKYLPYVIVGAAFLVAWRMAKK